MNVFHKLAWTALLVTPTADAPQPAPSLPQQGQTESDRCLDSDWPFEEADFEDDFEGEGWTFWGN